MGRRFGSRVLDVLCRMSLDASTCVNRAQGSIARRGGVTLLFAKFVPGVSTIAAPIAGQAGMSFREFVVYDMIGTLVWAATWLFTGRFFGDMVRRSDPLFATLTHFAVGLGAADGPGHHHLSLCAAPAVSGRAARAAAGAGATAGDDGRGSEREEQQAPFIIDLRHPLDVLTDPEVLPGALRIGPDELRMHRDEIPNDREIVLYCTCPSEQTSAKVAMELRRLGVTSRAPAARWPAGVEGRRISAGVGACEPRPATRLTAHSEVDGDGGLDLGGLTVEQERTIARLAHGSSAAALEHRWSAEDACAFDAAAARDDGVDDDGAFDVGGFGDGWDTQGGWAR